MQQEIWEEPERHDIRQIHGAVQTHDAVQIHDVGQTHGAVQILDVGQTHGAVQIHDVGQTPGAVQAHGIEIIRSSRKSMSLEIRPDLKILVRAPYGLPQQQIQKFVAEKEDWIEKHLEIMRARQEEKKNRPPVPKMTMEEIHKLAQEALLVIPRRAAYFAPVVGVSYGRITIRNQRSRWGSCSAKGNLNFNCLLMKTPPEVIDYVVVHELCHRKEMNHSPRFWAEVEKVLPDYRKAKKWLKENGGAIIGSMVEE